MRKIICLFILLFSTSLVLGMGNFYVNGKIINFNLKNGWIQIQSENGLKYKLNISDKKKMKNYLANKSSKQTFNVDYGNAYIINKKGKEIPIK